MGSLRITKNRKIYVRFSYAEKQREEPTAYYCIGKGTSDCKCRECKSARAIVMAVEREIRENTFDYSKYFPKSKALKELGYYAVDKNILFSTYAERYLQSSTIAKTTYRVYKNRINKICKHFGEIPINKIVPIMIREWAKKELSLLKPRYYNGLLVVFFSIMESAKRDKLIDENPLKYVARKKVYADKADPIFLDEIEKILNYCNQSYPQFTLFFAIGFFMGLRVGEIMGLKWSDFDFNKNILRVQRTITDGYIKESTKTRLYRDIPIPEILYHYINNHKQYTYMKREWLFLNSKNKPYLYYIEINRIWKHLLFTLKIRYRETYQMRHSFACNSLSAGFEMSYIQMMLGHSTLNMLLTIYGNFIPNNYNKNGFKTQHLKQWGNNGEKQTSNL